MRSCEYSDVMVKGKTELLQIKDVQFYNKKKLLHSRWDDTEKNATSVTITFRNQKNGDKGAMVTQHRNKHELCPVKNLDEHNHQHDARRQKLRRIKSKDVLKRIREVVKTFGKKDLGFDYTEIGTHSIRSSTAMQLFLNKYPTYQIVLLGR